MELDYVKLKQIKPVISGYIRESQSLLRRSEIPDEKSVHDIRVFMKKSRALLKLLAYQTDNPYYERDINDLREVGRVLCFRRDTSVYRKTLKDFKKEFPDIFTSLKTNAILLHLLEKQKQPEEVSDEMRQEIRKIDLILNKTGYRIRFHPVKTIDPQLLLKELDSTYSTVADIYLKCRNNPKPVALHKFRKTAKDFLYQLYIFRPLNPAIIKNLERKIENLTVSLGKFNDLNQIVKVLGYKYTKGDNLPALDELIVKIRDRQDRYLTKVWAASYDIFCPGQKLVNVLGFKLLVI
jgi:CHAD domain-containing protein